ncbi:hypothetical protein ABNC92_10525 [Paenibacillus larvae]|uniref:Uncharacterized protein n=1 Tax=Paenibacillus phage Tripp TaxID=1718161 RepID=A0A0N9RTI3_9CAUD|nr:hypothetical protein [Paenibacillus larvae]YP_009210530.1 hypothetical protein TRIPP_10 [Paenibacillus phage Tripp]ALH46383.1 hypothetical protein TRIPP_10 [Paenibacillus phage Tripp]ETK27964.1 hypothetical protein ERIC1_1c14190 [Paenibacillus larvae subsp. larvae DSM 25719]
MPLIPMRQTLQVERGSGELDKWGNPKPGASTEYKCRADEGLFVTDDMQARVTGKSEVANVKFLLDRLADIRPDDHLKYVNELGKKYEGRPKKVRVLRDIGGKALLTEVLL